MPSLRCRLAVFLTIAALALSCAPRTKPSKVAAQPIRFSTSERFNAAAITPYAGDHTEVYAYIDAHISNHLEHIQRWLRQPSVSAENRGIREMAELLRADLLSLGFQEAELVPTSGHPGVWGYYEAGAQKTVVIYMMYDVQPVEPADWQSPPFEARIVDHRLGRAVMARGATNQKGPQRACLNAVEAIRAVRGKLPVNLVVVAEGEEELGSPHFSEIIDRYADRLRGAEGVIFPSNSQSAGGQVTFNLGVKGIIYFELEAQGGAQGGPANAEIHGSLKAMTDAPAWRLVQALATLTTPDGNTITVPGYYDAIRPPSEEEQRLVNARVESWTQQEPTYQQSLGVQRWVDGISGKESLARSVFATTLNIDGIWGGYTGPGSKTILPHKATAKVDSRLVPNQMPEEALRLIRTHLDARGFSDIQIRLLGGYPPAQTSVSAPLVHTTIGVFNKYGRTPGVSPRSTGSAPYYLFTQRLSLPMISAGSGHGSGAHGPNEYMIVEPAAGSKITGLEEVERFYVDLLYAIAEER